MSTVREASGGGLHAVVMRAARKESLHLTTPDDLSTFANRESRAGNERFIHWGASTRIFRRHAGSESGSSGCHARLAMDILRSVGPPS